MKAIQKKCFVFAAFTGFLILTGTMLFAFGRAASEIQGQVLPISVTIASGISAGYWMRERGKLKIARLIAENSILHIRTAVISNISDGAAQLRDIENTEVFISYFGILLGAKIVRFNQDGIRLRTVEIGDDFISFTYGTEKRTQNIWLLRPPIDPTAIAEFSERFRYETGITPTLLC